MACTIIPPISSDPAITQLGNQLLTINQYYNSPTNLANILNQSGGGSGLVVGDRTWIDVISGGGGTYIVNHSGPSVSYATGSTLTSVSLTGTTLNLTSHIFDFDSHGHALVHSALASESRSVDLSSIAGSGSSSTTVSAWAGTATEDEFILTSTPQYFSHGGSASSVSSGSWIRIHAAGLITDPSPAFNLAVRLVVKIGNGVFAVIPPTGADLPNFLYWTMDVVFVSAGAVGLNFSGTFGVARDISSSLFASGNAVLMVIGNETASVGDVAVGLYSERDLTGHTLTLGAGSVALSELLIESGH